MEQSKIENRRMEKFKNIDVYPVLCEELSLGRSHEEILRLLIKGGARIVQYREKNKTKKQIYEQAKKLREIAKQKKILFIMNDHIDIATAIDADGVHLGQADLLPCKVIRKILGKDKLIGISTHNLKEALDAQEDGASYINIGPIFSTQTKKNNFIKPLGIELFKRMKTKIHIPYTVMGGINETNIEQLVLAGASRIAMVSALVSQKDVEKATKKYINLITGINK